MDAHTSPSSSLSSSSAFTNYPLVSALIAYAIAQSIKFLTCWNKEKRWDLKQLCGSGGMPSSHSSTVSALAVAICVKEGFGGWLFAAALIFASIVMYDASGVRLQAGRQAEIVYELPAEHPLSESQPLLELPGHTPTQVVCLGLLQRWWFICSSSYSHSFSLLYVPICWHTQEEIFQSYSNKI